MSGKLGMLTAALVLLGAGASRGAEADLRRLAAEAPDRGDDPDADALVLKETRTIVLDETGKRTETFHRVVKVFTPLGIKRFADPRFPFDEARQAFRVLAARTLVPDGTIVETPPRGINVVTPRACVQAPAYASRREAVVSHVGIEAGALLEIEIEIADREGGRRGVWGVEVFGDRVPVLEKTLVVDVPDPEALRSNMLGIRGGKGKWTAFEKPGVWTLEDVPAFPEEPCSPPLEELAPGVAYSTLPSWDAWGRDFLARFEKAAGGKLPGDLEEEIEEIRKKKRTDVERILALETVLSRRVRKVPYDFETGELRPASRTWREGYAHAADLGALWRACLERLGLEGHPALFSRARHKPRFAIPSSFPALRIRARSEDGSWWIDPLRPAKETGFSAPPLAWHVRPSREGASGPAGPVRKGTNARSAEVRGTIVLRPGGTVLASLTVELHGALNPWFVNGTRGPSKGAIREAVRKVLPGAEIGTWVWVRSGPDKTIAALSCKAEGAVKPEGGIARLALPGTFFLDPPVLPSPARAHPYRFDSPFAETVELWIEPPAGWKAAALPAPVSGEIGGAFRMSVLGWHKGGDVLLFRSVEAPGGDVGAGDLARFRSLLARWKSAPSRTVLFETGGEGK